MIVGILLTAALASRADVPARWIEVRSEHFRVLTDGSEKQASRVLEQFERIRWMFHTLFPYANGDPVEPIVVVAAKDAGSFQAFEPAAYRAHGQLNVAGMFTRTYDKNYVLLRLDARFEFPFAPVYHEYTHLQLSGNAGWMPLWLDEGLAVFFENTEITEKNVTLGAPSTEHIVSMRNRQLIPLAVLLRVDRTSPYYHEEQKGTMFYAESWALTHMLELADHDQGTQHINDYLDMVRNRMDPVVAAEKAFGDLKTLEQNLGRYMRANRYRTFVLSTAGAQIDVAGYKFRALSQAEAEAIRADVLAATHREPEARALLQAVLKSAPETTQAYETMGTLEYREKNRDASIKWYRDAIRLSSENYFVYFNFANLAMSSEEPWDNPEIESSLRTAIRLNPRYYPASDFLAVLLSSLNRDEEAVAVLEKAQQSAATPADAEKAQAHIARVKAATVRKQQSAQSDEQSAAWLGPARVPEDPGPKHPTEKATGPKHIAKGIIRGVQCTYPAIIEFRIEGTGRAVRVYTNDYTALEYTVLGFLPKGNLHPCDEFEGMKARVTYVASSDKTIDGQIVAMELRK
jgi:tetratricopeptide (TPR) repeat protein